MKEWKTGDVITAEDMNRLETSVIVVEIAENQEEDYLYIPDWTFDDLYAKFVAGTPICCAVNQAGQYARYELVRAIANGAFTFATVVNESIDTLQFYKQADGSIAELDPMQQ